MIYDNKGYTEKIIKITHNKYLYEKLYEKNHSREP